MQEYFTPNASQPKEYPNGFNPPMRWICALHEDESGNVWLMKFRTDIGEWEKERTATQVDRDFFSFRKIIRCWSTTARPAPAGSEESEEGKCSDR